MDKKNRAAFENFPDGNQNADFAGENPAGYLAPEVSVCDFALENGFAVSILNYNTASATTDQLEVESEWNTNGEGESFF